MDFRRYALSTTICSLLTLAGCTTQPTRPDAPAVPPRVEAEAALARGAPAEAASAYLEAAERAAEPTAAARFRLEAAALLLTAEQAAAARDALTRLPGNLPPALQSRRDLLTARLHLLEGTAAEALAILQRPAPATLKQDWLRARADALAALDRSLDAARVLAELLEQSADPAAATALQTQLWDVLSAVPMETLRGLMPPAPDAFGGWIELAFLFRSLSLQPAELAHALQQWQQRYPGHPATGELLAQIITAQQSSIEPPNEIALLLPLSGPLQAAGEAIRDGFLAAYYAASGEKPGVRVYDVGEEGGHALDAYDKAVGAGADFVVGPLTKESLVMLAARGNLPVPALALNTLPAGYNAPQGLYQFGLPPEDEAVAAADYAITQGHDEAVLLAPAGEWGQRVAEAFAQGFSQRGGRVLETTFYEPGSADFSDPIQSALNLDASDRRFRELRSTLRRQMEFEPYRRQDVDVVFLAAYPREGRLIRPQLKFFHAIDLPVIATSHVYSGTEDPRADQDLDGVTFVDMPWLLSPSPTDGALSREALAEIAATAGAPRLVALGIDAFRLVPYLENMRSSSGEAVEGTTGALSVDPTGRVHRRLLPAQFADGKVQITPQPRTYGRDTTDTAPAGPASRAASLPTP